MQKFEVGKPFLGKTHYQDGIRFGFDQSGASLCIYYSAPTPDEVETIRQGEVKLGLYITGDIIFLLIKFGDLDWMDAPYNWHLSKPYAFGVINEGFGFGMTVFFVDATTGILEVARLVGWVTEMSKSFMQEVEAQKVMEFNKSRYHVKLNEIYLRYTTDDLVKQGHIFKGEL